MRLILILVATLPLNSAPQGNAGSCDPFSTKECVQGREIRADATADPGGEVYDRFTQ